MTRKRITPYFFLSTCLCHSVLLLPVATAQQQVPVQQVPGQQPAQTQTAGQQRIPIVTVQDAVAAGDARTTQAPWVLTPQEQAYVDQVLAAWESSTGRIKRYSCDLQRWQFNPGFYDQGYFSHAVGTLRYQSPGKGEFKVEEVKSLTEKGPPAKYAVNPREPHGEHWICDGEWVHILDQNKKTALRVQMPPEFRGQLVYRSPLPFLFGINAEEAKQRYWIRPLMVPDRPGELWLEVKPKRADDAGNYSRVQVILDREDILPSGLIVFMPNWTEQAQHREVYQFANRETNKAMDAVMEGMFNKVFIPTKLGSDWDVSEEPYIPPQMQNGAPQGRVAAPPANQPPRR